MTASRRESSSMDIEYYVLTVKRATGASKYFIVFEHEETATLVVYDKSDVAAGAFATAEYLNRGDQ